METTTGGILLARRPVTMGRVYTLDVLYHIVFLQESTM